MKIDLQNPISISGDITSDENDFYDRFILRFSEVVASTLSGDTITLFINSRSGKWTTALGIYDVLKVCDRTIVGIVAGKADFAGSLILQACDERLITENSYLSPGLGKLTHQGLRIYSERCGVSKHELIETCRNRTLFCGQEAVDAKFADAILK